MRLIDADKINYREHTECMGHGDFETVRTVTDKEIAEIPTVDAVKVVRCRDCKGNPLDAHAENAEGGITMDVREKLVELLKEIVAIQECGFGDPRPTYETVASYLISHGVTVQDNTEITDEPLKQLRNAPLTVLCEEPTIEVVQEWISVSERLPQNFVSVLGYMTDAGEFPPVRECYTVGNAFFFPALGDIHPVSHWCELPQPPKGE